MKIYSVRILALLGLFFPSAVFATTANHLVISQVQITGGAGRTTNDFVELYNPTSADIDLNGHRLVKRTKTGTSDITLKSWTSAAVVPAQGYFLWANSNFTSIGAVPNATTTGSIADDNGVAVRQGPENTGTVIDSVGWGAAANAFVEGAPFPTNPAGSESLERSEDTENNAADFFIQTTAHPRNSQSSAPMPPPSPLPPPQGAPTVPPPPGGAGFALEISEILPNPKGNDTGSEWAELYNGSSGQMDVSGWMLDDEDVLDIPSKNAYVIPANTIIPGLGYLAVYIPKGKFALNNTGSDTLRLFDSGKNLRLGISYSGAKEGFSYARDSGGIWQWSDSPTPNAANEFPATVFYPADLIISEALANPEGDDEESEFIEIHNPGTDAVDLADWVIADAARRYVISGEDFLDTEIPAGGYFLIPREISSIGLNNNGSETVSLYDPLGTLVSTVAFADAREGAAYAWSTGKTWQWTAAPTPGLPNQMAITASAPPPPSPLPNPPPQTSETGQGEGTGVTPSPEEGEVKGAVEIEATLPRTGGNFWLILAVLAITCYGYMVNIKFTLTHRITGSPSPENHPKSEYAFGGLPVEGEGYKEYTNE